MLKRHNILAQKVVSLVLAMTFSLMNANVVLAQKSDLPTLAPLPYGSPDAALAAQSPFQENMMTEAGEKFRRSLLSDMEVLKAIFCVGQYLFGDNEEGLSPLPLDYMEDVLTTRNGGPFRGVDLAGARMDKGVVIVPCANDIDIQIADARKLSKSSLRGYEWIVSDKYVVKVVPAGMENSAAFTQDEAGVSGKDPVISDKVAEIEAPYPSGDNGGAAKTKQVSVKGVMYAFNPFAFVFMADIIASYPGMVPVVFGGIAAATAVWLSWKVIRSMSFMIEKHIRELLSLYPDKRAKKALVRIGKKAGPALMRFLEENTDALGSEGRGLAMEALGEIRYKAARELIIKSLMSRGRAGEVPYNSSAIIAMGYLYESGRDGKVLERIIGKLRKGGEKDHLAAIAALRRIKGERAVAALVDFVNSPARYEGLNENKMLYALDVLDELAGIKNVDVHKAVIYTFGCGFDPRSVKYLETLFPGKIPDVLRKAEGKRSMTVEDMEILSGCLMNNVPFEVKIVPGGTWHTLSQSHDDEGNLIETPEVGQYRDSLDIIPKGILPKSKLEEERERKKEEKRKKQEELARKAPKKMPYFKVNSAVNNIRARFIGAGNVLTRYGGVNKEVFNSSMTALEIKALADECVRQLGDVQTQEGASKEVLEAARLARDGRAKMKMEISSLIAAIIAKALSAKKEGQPLIIGLETNWMPGAADKDDPRSAAFTALRSQLTSLGDILRSLGLDNVVVVHGEGDDLAHLLTSKVSVMHAKLTSVIVLASEKTIRSKSFEGMGSTPDKKKAFLAGVDTTKVEEAVKAETGSEKAFVDLVELLTLTLELAAGKHAPDHPLIKSYDKKLRMLILLPQAELVDFEKIIEIYRSQRKVLMAA